MENKGKKKFMQLTSRSLLLAACAAAVVASLSLTGCQTGDRTTGRYIDDRMVTRRVKSNLDHDPYHKLEGISVTTFAGVVQLSGFVDAKEQVTAAGEVASRTEGVRQVVNSVVVKPRETLVSPTGYPTGKRYDADYDPATQPLPQQQPSGTTTNTNNYPFRR